MTKPEKTIKSELESMMLSDIHLIEKENSQGSDDPLVQFVSDMAELETVDASDETVALIRDSILEGSFQLTENMDEVATEILDEHIKGEIF